MLQKMLQQLATLRQRNLELNATPITGLGVDVAYEAGRRLGVVQGITSATHTIHEFLADTNEKDTDL